MKVKIIAIPVTQTNETAKEFNYLDCKVIDSHSPIATFYYLGYRAGRAKSWEDGYKTGWNNGEEYIKFCLTEKIKKLKGG